MNVRRSSRAELAAQAAVHAQAPDWWPAGGRILGRQLTLELADVDGEAHELGQLEDDVQEDDRALRLGRGYE